MFNGNEIKKVIIVCDEKTKVYANYLSQLIAKKDDCDDQVVGCKDETVEATVWLEKIYLANEPELSSNTNIIFIGDIKSAKSIIPNIDLEFNNYGISYGWLGKRAVIYVNTYLMEKNGYKEFSNCCKEKQKQFEKVELNFVYNENGKHKLVEFFMPYKIMISFVYTSISIFKKIKEQQYRFAILSFYLDHLSNFLGE